MWSLNGFAPRGEIDASLFEGEPAEIPHLRGAIVLEHVSLRTPDGNTILDDLNLEIPKGARVAIEMPNQTERTALAELLTREALPSRGRITMAGHNLAELHQAVLAARIGYAHSNPYLFQGTVGDNLLMSLRSSPKTVLWDPKMTDRAAIETQRSGNSLDSTKADWLDPGLANLNTRSDIYDWCINWSAPWAPRT